MQHIAADRFRMHDVLYRYARAKAIDSTDSEWRSNAIANVCRVYEVIAQTEIQRIGFVDKETMTPSPSNSEAIQILDADVPTIRAIAEAARELGLWEQIVTLSQTYSAFLHHRGHLDDFIHIQRLVMQAGQQHDNHEWTAAASLNLAQAAHTLGDNEQAVTLLRQSQDHAQLARDVVGFHQAVALYGNILLEAGRSDEAIGVLKKTLKIWKLTDNPDLLAQTLCNIGTAHLAAGQWEQAEAYLRNARRTGDGGLNVQRTVTNNLAILLHRSGRGALARSEDDEQANFSRSIGDREGEAYGLLRIAGAQSDIGDLDAAAELVAQALQLFEEVGNIKGRITAMLDQGKLAAAQGNATEAMNVLDRCTRIAVDADDLPSAATAASALSSLLWEIGSTDDAQHWQETAIELARETGNPLVVAEIMAGHGRALIARGLPARAAEALRQAIELLTPLGDSEILTRTHISIADAMVRSGQAHEALPLLKQVLDRDPEATGPQFRSYALRIMAGLFLRRGLHDEADEHSTSAMMYAQRSGSEIEIMECHVIQGHIHMTSGNHGDAVTAYNAAIDLARKARRINAILSIRGNRAQCLYALVRQPNIVIID